MSDQVVDVEAVADRLLSGPAGLASLTRIEAVALAGFVLRVNSGEVPQLQAPEAPLERALPASLAVAVASFIRAHDILLKEGGVHSLAEIHASRDAFNDLKTRFEKEFPVGSA